MAEISQKEAFVLRKILIISIDDLRFLQNTLCPENVRMVLTSLAENVINLDGRIYNIDDYRERMLNFTAYFRMKDDKKLFAEMVETMIVRLLAPQK